MPLQDKNFPPPSLPWIGGPNSNHRTSCYCLGDQGASCLKIQGPTREHICGGDLMSLIDTQ